MWSKRSLIDRLGQAIATQGEWALHLLGILLVASALAEGWLSNSSLAEKRWLSYAIGAFLLLFYTHQLWLIPHYLKHRRWAVFLAWQLAIGLVLAGLAFVACRADSCSTHDGPDLLVGASIGGTVLALAYTFSRDWVRHSLLIDKLRAEKLAMELAFLKSQVDPHFLFNSLNSLYALALEEDSPKTADGIVKLGALMRYNLHDSQAELIPLQKEVDYITQYVDLQRLRLSAHHDLVLNINIPSEQLNTRKIAPMLLIPFVENAFKYGLSSSMATHIAIELELVEHSLGFRVRNKIVAAPTATRDMPALGLQNVQSRLQLLYPGQHDLQLHQTDGTFFVSLQITWPS